MSGRILDFKTQMERAGRSGEISMDESSGAFQIGFAHGRGRTRSARYFDRSDPRRGMRDPVKGLVAGEIVERKQRVTHGTFGGLRTGAQAERNENQRSENQ